jgi:Transposase and inactivated derivatives
MTLFYPILSLRLTGDNTMIFIGIDISKLTFDAAYFNNSSYVHKQFSNNTKGFGEFFLWMNKSKKEAFTCLEATGIYSFNLAQYLSQQKIKVMVVNPMITHAFFKMELNRNKTDKADAQLIARYCEHAVLTGDFEKKLYQPKGEDYEAIQRLVTRCDQLEKSKTQENNRLEASVNKDASRSIKRLLKAINNEIIKVKKNIASIVNNNQSLRHQVDLLTSINGIGERTAWSILAYIGDINFFSNSKQIASYAGLTPKITQSGTSINKSSLSKLGHKRLRKSLYMPALVAIRYNPILTALYERLVSNGKPKKVAIIAVMRKLLILSYGVLKSENAFDVNYQS